MTAAVLDPAGVDAAVGRLVRLAGGAETVGSTLGAGLGGGVGGWSGTAAEAAAAGHRDVALRAGRVADLAVRASLALAAYGQVARRVADERHAQDRTEQRLVEVRGAALAAGMPSDDLDRRAAALARARDATSEELTAAAHRAARALAGLRAEVTDRPRDGLDHLGEAGRAFWGAGLGGTLAAFGSLAGQVREDPAATLVEVWKASFTAPAEALRHPVRTARELTGWDAFTAGHWGEGLGTAAGSLAGGALAGGRHVMGKVATPRVKAPDVPGYPDGPVPALQTVDELLDGVKLAQHEHLTLGHAVTRHVDVDREYLERRLVDGTLEPDGTRSFVPPAASAWRDLDTAEREITQILKANEALLRTYARSTTTEPLPLSGSVAKESGVVLTLQDGTFSGAPAATGRVVIVRSADGGLYIKSAYPET